MSLPALPLYLFSVSLYLPPSLNIFSTSLPLRLFNSLFLSASLLSQPPNNFHLHFSFFSVFLYFIFFLILKIMFIEIVNCVYIILMFRQQELSVFKSDKSFRVFSGQSPFSLSPAQVWTSSLPCGAYLLDIKFEKEKRT